MKTDIRAVAEAFSSHRFAEAYDHLADDVRWEAIGSSVMDGRDAIVGACEQTLASLAEVTVEPVRFRSVAGADTVAVDTLTRYVAADGQVSIVSSCDFYRFADDRLVTITSYAAEVDAETCARLAERP